MNIYEAHIDGEWINICVVPDAEPKFLDAYGCYVFNEDSLSIALYKQWDIEMVLYISMPSRYAYIFGVDLYKSISIAFQVKGKPDYFRYDIPLHQLDKFDRPLPNPVFGKPRRMSIENGEIVGFVA
jgi:hypothetical protein